MSIDEQVAQAAAECDERFDRAQPALIATLRTYEVSEAEMPDVLTFAYDEYERQRITVLDQLRTLLQRLAVAQARSTRMHP